MATQNHSNINPTSAPLFTQWGRGMDRDPRLTLMIENPDRTEAPIEYRELDIRTLPDRPDLVARMPDRFRDRMMKEAAAAKASKYLVDVPILSELIGSNDPADYVTIPVVEIKAGAA